VLQLIESIVTELERPRELTNQVVKHLDGTYGVDRDAVGPFLKERLPQLEDDEHDLILSPLFTPKLADQSVFAEQLGRRSIPRKDWPALIQQLTARPTHARLVTSDRQTHTVRLREVSIERFVNRLRLDGTISDSIVASINWTPPADQPMLKAIARRGVWESDTRCSILDRYLRASLAAGTYNLSDAVNLLKLAEDYLPVDAPALLERIPRWQKLLEEEINSAFDPKPFFSTTVQQMHGGNDQRQRDEARALAKRNELAFLERLQRMLAAE